ncbi:MAG: caspase family protein [Planctomycetota bacterium]|jgi:hypothetical protein|nr:caspase family protein [Planctomycetota bacterium]MDP6941639.1 caspase family protein [Planctomycetota bacterium]
MISVALLVALPALPISPTPTPQKAPEKLALLVGINEYKDPPTPALAEGLDGCVNDIHRMEGVLKRRFGFSPRNIKILLDGEATHENIVRQFDQWLIQRAGPNTEVLFWYSGHGSRIPDASKEAGAEKDGLDSTFLANNSRAGGDSFDITDDEIHSLLRALCAKTDRVTVITDSCHSGGVTRGPGGAKTRAASAGSSPLDFNRVKSFWPKNIPFLEDGDSGRFAELPYVHLAACASHQKAGEVEVRARGGEWTSFGVFSFFLTNELEKLQPGTTYRELARRVALRVAEQKANQDIQIEGAMDRRVFGAEFEQRPPGFSGTALTGGDGIDIDAGTVHLLRRKSIVEVRDLDGKTLGKARIRNIWAESSTARWVGKPPTIEKAEPVQVIEIERAGGEDPLLVYVPEGKLGDAVVSELNKSMGGLLDIVRQPAKGNGYQLFIPEGSSEMELATCADGLVLYREKNTSWKGRAQRIAKSVTEELNAEFRHNRLLNLANTPSELDIKLRLEPIPESQVEDWIAAGSLPEDAQPGRIEHAKNRSADDPGPVVTFHDEGGKRTPDMVQFVASLPENAPPMYIALLDISESRELNVIFPKAGLPPVQIKGGEEKVIVASLYLDENWPSDRPMRDRFLLIATEQPADFSPFEGKSRLVKTRGDGGVLVVLEDGGIPPELIQALSPPNTRGATSFTPSKVRFGVTALDVLVTGK